MFSGKIHHIAIIVSNYEISKDFYVNKLGFQVVSEVYRKERSDYILNLRLGECNLELFVEKDPPARVSNPEACGLRHLAFAVPDIGEAVRALQAQGIATEPVRTDPYTGTRMTFFRDPDGLPLELHE